MRPPITQDLSRHCGISQMPGGMRSIRRFRGWRRCRVGWNASADHADDADAEWDGI